MPQPTSRRFPSPPLDWPPDYLNYLSQYTWEDREAARTWWILHTRASHKHLLNTSVLGIALSAGVLYAWDATQGCYVDRRKRPVPWQAILAVWTRTLAHATARLLKLTQLWLTGESDLAEWQTGMRRELQAQCAAAVALAVGGWAFMQVADWLLVSNLAHYQLAKLGVFAQQLATAQQRRDGTLLRRVRMYGHAGWGAFQAAQGQVMRRQGYTEECNVLGVAEHCEGCLEVTSRGWTPIGSLTPVGQRTCLSACQCYLIYRRRAP